MTIFIKTAIVKYCNSIVYLIAITLIMTSCHKSNNTSKAKGLGSNRNWHGYSTVDRYYQSASGADSTALHDTSTTGDQHFALTVVSDKQILYSKQPLTLTTNTDSIQLYTSDMIVSPIRILHTDVFYYKLLDSIVIGSMLTTISNSPITQTDKFYSRQWTYK